MERDYWQKALLEKIRARYPNLSSPTEEAFLKAPRDAFVPHFSADYESWLQNTSENFPLIYSDTTLLLHAEREYISTISQPSFVLRMLDLLDLRPGQKVFELGAGSGWNAALMGLLVGPKGRVLSYEIIPEMATLAEANIRSMGLDQVTIHAGDAIAGFKDEAPFDRGIFTAGARDLPGFFLEGFKNGGKFLFVLSTGEGDLLLAMEKQEEDFVVFNKIHCQFVKVTGDRIQKYHHTSLAELYRTTAPIRITPKGKSLAGKQIIEGHEVNYVIG
jgi:protein-L-isoaspartate(D-aspartate) O-methyltransferase